VAFREIRFHDSCDGGLKWRRLLRFINITKAVYTKIAIKRQNGCVTMKMDSVFYVIVA